MRPETCTEASCGTSIRIESHIFPGAGGTGLQLTTKRYTSPARNADDGLTLVFAHCLGAHKEQWEPTIERILHIQQRKIRRQQIREAWAFDWQSHGEAAVVNQHLLESRSSCVSAIEWATALESFIRHNLHGHRIVLIGHSAGSGVILAVMKNFPIATSPFVAVFLVEPMLISRELFNIRSKERRDSARRTMELTLQRRDSWPDKGTAMAYLRRRLPWKLWDSRVLERYIRHGLRTVDIPEGEFVTIKTSKRQEGLSYIEFDPYIDGAKYYRERCDHIPFHIIFGAKIDFVPRYMQDALCDVAGGYKPASISRIPYAGHLVVQEQPDRLAAAICERLGAKDTRASPRL